jgi:hypothetical protein
MIFEGHAWKFVIPTKDVEGEYTYYESGFHCLEVDWYSVKIHSHFTQFGRLAVQWVSDGVNFFKEYSLSTWSVL